ncbi:MAG: hypothetical protein C7B44_03240 [Sulfobacillus thermosulfidooxidans]|nr:MAG: hypothetical protein C7B44_03240 [Sulfobacillus thermosulfidooxidans]
MIMGITMGNGQCSQGRIYIVGIGPGDVNLLSMQARQALEQAQVIIGYHGYMRLIAAILHPQRQVIVTKNLSEEIERAQLAMEYACQGQHVAVISSGDAGIYGMASVVFEWAARQHESPEIVVLPGISALQAAAARCGAPLSHDFAAISLSDLLTPWPLIEKRLQAAIRADFVLALYNPRSQRRQKQWERAQAIIRTHCSPRTPVGIVRNAFRDGESVVITDVAHLEPDAVDMFTIVLIGNSQSFVWNSRMITPRGYYPPTDRGPRVLVLGGTREAKIMAERLGRRGARVTLSYRLPPPPGPYGEGVMVRWGAWDDVGLAQFLRDEGIAWIVDMTHPDAQIIQKVARWAAREQQVPYLRWERPRGLEQEALVRRVDSHQQAAAALRQYQGNVLLLTGIKSLAIYTEALADDPEITVMIRLLPRSETLLQAEQLGLGPHQMVAMVGPYSAALNGAIYDRYNIRAVVVKDSSDDLASKVEPALERGIAVIMVQSSSDGVDEGLSFDAIECQIFETSGAVIC